jgi:hypothetical protein
MAISRWTCGAAIMRAFVKVQNLDHEIYELPRITLCNTFGTRLRGLMFRRTLGRDEGLLLVGGRDHRLDSAIHMLFVPFDLAVIWIDSGLEVADKVLARAWRAAYVPTRPAKYVLELHPVHFSAYDVGHRVEIIDA